jgi:hypothetical protein
MPSRSGHPQDLTWGKRHHHAHQDRVGGKRARKVHDDQGEEPTQMYNKLKTLVNKIRSYGSTRWTDHDVVWLMLRSFTVLDPHLVNSIRENLRYIKMTPEEILGKFVSGRMMIKEARYVDEALNGLCFPLHKMLVEVLKRFEMFLHQLTPEALIRVGVFIWVVRSQGLEPDTNCFCNIHELSYQTKATRKEQYNNNFGCYSFVYRSSARRPAPTFRKNGRDHGWKVMVYVKNNLVKREDIKCVIQLPIRSRFDIKRPTIVNTERAQACLVAFNAVCSYISTKDLVQDHIAFKVCPLVNEWEMPKETDASSS